MDNFYIREANPDDLSALLNLYSQLHPDEVFVRERDAENIFLEILADKRHHVLVGIKDDSFVSSCVLLIVPNLTRGCRPYALIENVITEKSHRRKGYATAVLDFARSIAERENCYKIMLMTSRKDDATLRFYKNTGYNSDDKTAFVIRLR